MIQQVVLEGCGGAARGEKALNLAAREESLEEMATLTDVGVVDINASALVGATGSGREACTVFLLRQQEGGTGRYVNTRCSLDVTPLFCCFPLDSGQACRPKMVRLLVDAGGDATSTIVLCDREGDSEATPLEYVSFHLRKACTGRRFTEEQSNKLQAARRVLLQVEVVHAFSLLLSNAPPSTDSTAENSVQRAEAVATALAMTLPI